MTKLEKMLQEICPNGVKTVELIEVCDITKGIQFNKADMNDQGSYPVINGGIGPSGYIEQYNQDSNKITISQGGASAGFVNWITTKFWAGAHCYVLIPKDTVFNRYLYHFVKSKEYKLQECQYGAGIPHWQNLQLRNYTFPSLRWRCSVKLSGFWTISQSLPQSSPQGGSSMNIIKAICCHLRQRRHTNRYLMLLIFLIPCTKLQSISKVGLV